MSLRFIRYRLVCFRNMNLKSLGDGAFLFLIVDVIKYLFTFGGMDVKELRIGNLIYNGINEVFSVNGETINNFNVGQAILGSFKPIPLTEEWLIKLGFEEYSGMLYISVPEEYGGHIAKYKNQDNVRLEGCDDGQVGIDILYVHQLQNLYFALTGKELECKEA